MDASTQTADLSQTTVTWREADPDGVTVRVYAVTECLHTPTETTTEVQCMVNGDTIPRTDLILLGTAPAAAGTFIFTAALGEGPVFGYLPDTAPPNEGTPVYTVVVQAVNDAGGSLFAIAGTESMCYQCTY